MTHGELLSKAIKASGNTREEAAALLKISIARLYTLLKQAAIDEELLKRVITVFKLPEDYFTIDTSIELAPVSEREYKLMERIVALQQELIDALKKK